VLYFGLRNDVAAHPFIGCSGVLCLNFLPVKCPAKPAIATKMVPKACAIIGVVLYPKSQKYKHPKQAPIIMDRLFDLLMMLAVSPATKEATVGSKYINAHRNGKNRGSVPGNCLIHHGAIKS
jgi:hypothetical protein